MRPVTPSRARASNRAAASSARLTRFSPSEHPMLRPNSSSSHGAIGSFPDQSGDSLDTPRLDFEACRDFFPLDFGGEGGDAPTHPFYRVVHPLIVNGAAASSVDRQRDGGLNAVDL